MEDPPGSCPMVCSSLLLMYAEPRPIDKIPRANPSPFRYHIVKAPKIFSPGNFFTSD